MPKITALGAGSAPANNDVVVLVSNTAGTANTQKVTVNTFFSNVTANANRLRPNFCSSDTIVSILVVSPILIKMIHWAMPTTYIMIILYCHPKKPL